MREFIIAIFVASCGWGEAGEVTGGRDLPEEPLVELIEKLPSADATDRQAAMEGIRPRLGKIFEPDDGCGLRAELAMRAEAKPLLDKLVPIIAKGEDPDIAQIAAYMVLAVGVDAQRAVAALEACLADQTRPAPNRAAAAIALNGIYLPPKSIIRSHRQLLRETIIELFATRPAEKDEAPGGPIEFEIDIEMSQLGMSIEWIADFSRTAQQKRREIPALIELLDDEHWGVRLFAIGILGAFGHDAHSALPALRKCSDDEVADVRRVSANVIGHIEESHRLALERMQPFLREIDSEDERVREGVYCMLANFGPVARDAIPKLVRRSRTDPPELRPVAIEALRRIDPDRFAR